VSYTGAAPASGGDWKATLTLTAANAGGQATASVAIALGQITGVTIAPTSVALTATQSQKFAATVQGSGTFDGTVTWSASAGAIDSFGNYTPPPEAGGALTVTVTATSLADSKQSASAAVMVIFNWVQYYAPEGLNDTATAVALSSDGTELVVADARDITSVPPNPADQHYTNQTAGLLLFNSQTGELKDATWTNSPTPSKLLSMVMDPATGTIYAAGYEGNDADRQALVLKITVADPLRVVELAKFQLNGERTEAHVLQLYGGNVWLGVNSDYKECPAPRRCSTGGDYAVIVDPTSGNREPEWPLNTFGPFGSTSITGMFVSSLYLYATGNIPDSNGNLLTTYLGHYNLTTGESQDPAIEWTYPPTFYNAQLFQNGSGELLLAGTLASSFTVQEGFAMVGWDTQLNENLNAGQWNGDNAGSVSVNRVFGAALNLQGGLTSVGSCSQIGSADPGLTDACAISRPGTQPTSQLVPITWDQRFDRAHVPGGTSAGWAGVIYDSQGTAYLAGWGTDGRSGCGAAPCRTVTVGKFSPPLPSGA
jgi:hypothetical protein